MAQRRTRPRPESERRVHVNPRARIACNRNELPERIEGAGIDLAGLHDRDDRARRGARRLREILWIHAALSVGLDAHHPVVPESEKLQRRKYRGVRIVPDQHRYRWST